MTDSTLLVATADSSRVAPTPVTKLMPIRFQELSEAVAGFERTGVSLVSLRGDSLIPTAGYTDDVGMYYLASKLAALFHCSAATAWDLFFFLIIIPSFAIGFIGMMHILETRGAKLFYGAMTSMLFVTVYLSGDIYALSPSLAMLMIPYLIRFSKSDSKPSAIHWAAWLLFGIVIMLGHLIRAHSATAIVLVFVVLLFFEKRWTMREKLLSLAVIAVGMFAVVMFFKTRYAERDAYLAKLQPEYVSPPQAHPFWHNVYIGFGFLDNDYGIRYQDEIAFKKAKEISPTVFLLDAEYERILRDEIIIIVKKNPLFVVRTVSAKAGVIGFYVLLFMNVGLFCAVRYGLKWQFEIALLSGMAFNALPGLLAVPYIPYLTGSFAFAVIYGAMQFDQALKKGFLKKSSDGTRSTLNR
ncbi:MAG: hypothetical protein SNJ55_09470 [Chloroherpetonaceae bacterium]